MKTASLNPQELQGIDYHDLVDVLVQNGFKRVLSVETWYDDFNVDETLFEVYQKGKLKIEVSPRYENFDGQCFTDISDVSLKEWRKAIKEDHPNAEIRRIHKS